MSNIRERILTMGVTGVGKSYQWLKMAEAMPKSEFFCIDMDNAIEYMIETQFPHLAKGRGGNVTVWTVYDWPEYRKALAEIKELDAEGNWIVLDMMDNAWSSPQRYFVQQLHDQDMGDYFLQARKVIKSQAKNVTSVSQAALDGWLDWSVINRLYDDFILPIVYRLKSHVYISTRVEMMDRNEKDPDNKLIFGPYGVKPAGQKKLGHQVHTCFVLLRNDKGEYFVTTIKDRANRPYFNKTRLINFYVQYLAAVAGWPMPEKM